MSRFAPPAHLHLSCPALLLLLILVATMPQLAAESLVTATNLSNGTMYSDQVVEANR